MYSPLVRVRDRDRARARVRVRVRVRVVRARVRARARARPYRFGSDVVLIDGVRAVTCLVTADLVRGRVGL